MIEFVVDDVINGVVINNVVDEDVNGVVVDNAFDDNVNGVIVNTVFDEVFNGIVVVVEIVVDGVVISITLVDAVDLSYFFFTNFLD